MDRLYDRIALLITSKWTTISSVTVAAVLWLAGAHAAQQLVELFGMRPDHALWLTNFARLVATITAAGGYSPVKRPEPTT